MTSEMIMLDVGSVQEISRADIAIAAIAGYGMPVGREVFETCVWIGRFMQACCELGVQCDRLYRKDIKLHLCGNLRAKDANV